MSRRCAHAEAIRPVAAPGPGCETCLATGSTWVHLRQCMTCGRTLCCDDSPNRHMSSHWREVGHPVMRTAEPGEDWLFCFADDAMLRHEDAGWQAFDWYVEAGIEAARAHAAGGGSLDDPRLPSAYGELAAWSAHVRKLAADGALDPDDSAAIEALPGWRW